MNSLAFFKLYVNVFYRYTKKRTFKVNSKLSPAVTSGAGVFNPGTPDVSGWINSWLRAVLCPVGGHTTPLASAHEVPGASPPNCLQIQPDGLLGNHHSRRHVGNFYFLCIVLFFYNNYVFSANM